MVSHLLLPWNPLEFSSEPMTTRAFASKVHILWRICELVVGIHFKIIIAILGASLDFISLITKIHLIPLQKSMQKDKRCSVSTEELGGTGQAMTGITWTERLAVVP